MPGRPAMSLFTRAHKTAVLLSFVCPAHSRQWCEALSGRWAPPQRMATSPPWRMAQHSDPPTGYTAPCGAAGTPCTVLWGRAESGKMGARFGLEIFEKSPKTQPQTAEAWGAG